MRAFVKPLHHDCVWIERDRRVTVAGHGRDSTRLLVGGVLTGVAQKRRLLGFYRQQYTVDYMGHL